MERYKALAVYIKPTLVSRIKERYPDLPDDKVMKVANRLLDMCRDTDLIKIINCLEGNMDKVVREVLYGTR